jgi:hypothetical protein
MAIADDCRTSDFRGGRNFREFKYATIRDRRYSQRLVAVLLPRCRYMATSPAPIQKLSTRELRARYGNRC